VQAIVETQDTPSRKLAIPRRGLGATDQLVPFQDSISALCVLLVSKLPTAVHAVAEVQDTLARKSPDGDGLGPGTTDQPVPFQDSIKVLDLPLMLWLPTAVHAVAETHDTS
jgi:hypothetical protein